MVAPKTHNGGNTARRESRIRIRHLNATDGEMVIRTESEFEEIHCERDKLGVGLCQVSREPGVCIRGW